MRTETFQTPGAVRVAVAVPAGRVEIEAVREATETTVELEVLKGDPSHEAEAKIELRERGNQSEVSVAVPRGRLFGRGEYRVTITTPAGAALDVSSASADVEARGSFSDFEVQTASGHLQADEITGRLKARTASGDFVFGRVHGDASVNSASGAIELAALGGSGTVRSASGDVVIGEAASDLSITTASGDQTVSSVAAGEVTLRSASGDVHVGIRRGSRVRVDARSGSGELESELELGDEEPAGDGPLVELDAATASGNVRVVRAKAG